MSGGHEWMMGMCMDLVDIDCMDYTSGMEWYVWKL